MMMVDFMVGMKVGMSLVKPVNSLSTRMDHCMVSISYYTRMDNCV